MYTGILVSISEIFLKGKNQGDFKKLLKKNILKMVSGNVKIKEVDRRYYLETDDINGVYKKLKSIPGVAKFAKVIFTKEKKVDKICKILMKILPKKINTFCSRVKRSDKSINMTSLEIEKKIAEIIFTHFGNIKIDLKNAETKVFLIFSKDGTFIFKDAKKGIGGLPVGSSGKIFSLISGGFDSPLASILMAKRGLEMDFVHFYSKENGGEKSIEKVKKIIKKLMPIYMNAKLRVVPTCDFVEELHEKNIEKKYRMIIFRYFMIDFICKLNETEKIKKMGITMGDSIGQVASQTLENLFCVSCGLNLPIYRPLIAMNKEEIIEKALFFEYAEIAKEKVIDVCSEISSKHPKTKMKMKNFEKQISKINFESVFKKSFIEMKEIEI